METVISDKKELAEKVAGMLGFEYCDTCNVWTSDEDVGDIMELISWKGVGLCIEKARDWGWDFQCKKGLVYFMNWKTVSSFPYEIKEHGHIEAIIRAFAEIPMEKVNG